MSAALASSIVKAIAASDYHCYVSAAELELHRFTTDEYHRMIEAGAFADDAHIELIHGLLVELRPRGRPHERVITWLNRWLIEATDGARYEVHSGGPLTLEEQASEPEPDLSVVPVATPQPYHAATAALVIEVAVSSLRRDLGVKRTLYAGAGVAEYWVIDIEGRRVVVHRDPRDGDYADVSEVGPNGELHARALELPTLTVFELMRAAAS
jgi:Uma2 family endonuclease